MYLVYVHTYMRMHILAYSFEIRISTSFEFLIGTNSAYASNINWQKIKIFKELGG